MERVVYILGAGFSAPLGLPVMSNFLEKAKDMYFGDPDTYAGFARVFKTVREMSYAKNFFSMDLHNIEEILSVLEMQQSLTGDSDERSFVELILEVIRYYTPELYASVANDVRFQGFFGGDLWSRYGFFVASLTGRLFLERRGAGPTELIVGSNSDREVQYSVVSLNYDMVLEMCTEHLNRKSQREDRVHFTPEWSDDSRTVPLAKLHGSLSEGTIIPPTWNKGLSDPHLSTWTVAYESIRQANHIRIIGYSLPPSDAYVKFLLKAASVDSPHLKTIDVICLDDADCSVQRRYDQFILSPRYKFFNARTEDYLDVVFKHATSAPRGKKGTYERIACNRLEIAHSRWVEDASEA